MNTVKMPRASWETVVMGLTMARDSGLIAYIDDLVDDIEKQIYSQEY